MKNQNNTHNIFDVKRIVGMAMFAALAYGVTFVFRIPVQFLTFDAKDAVLTIASFIYGPLAALVMALIPALIELITISSTGFWGFLMNFLSTAAFSCSCALIYKYKKNIKGAIVGLVSAALTMTAFMLLFNLFMARSPGFGSMATDFIRAINTRFPYASGTQYLKLASYYNSPDRSTKSTPPPVNGL